MRIRSLALAFCGLVFGAGHALAAGNPQQFDLICTGTETTATGSTPFTKEFSVDLATNTWCIGACQAVNAFVSVNPGTLTFMEHKADAHGVTFYDAMSVDRTSGRYLEVHRTDSSLIPGTKTSDDGKCEAAPFKPRAAAKF